VYSKDTIRETANAVIYHYWGTSYEVFGQWAPKSMGELRFNPRPFVLTTLLTMNKRSVIDHSEWSAKDLYQLGNQIIFDNCLETEGDKAKVKGYHPYVLEDELCKCYIRCLWAADQHLTVEDKQLFIWFDVPFYSLFDAPEYADEFMEKVRHLFPDDLKEGQEKLINKIVGEYKQFLDKNAAVVWWTVEQFTSDNEICNMVNQVKQAAYTLMNSRGSNDDVS